MKLSCLSCSKTWDQWSLLEFELNFSCRSGVLKRIPKDLLLSPWWKRLRWVFETKIYVFSASGVHRLNASGVSWMWTRILNLGLQGTQGVLLQMLPHSCWTSSLSASPGVSIAFPELPPGKQDLLPPGQWSWAIRLLAPSLSLSRTLEGGCCDYTHFTGKETDSESLGGFRIAQPWITQIGSDPTQGFSLQSPHFQQQGWPPKGTALPLLKDKAYKDASRPRFSKD